MPNGRCRKHGGLTPAPGPGHPNWKHGNESKIRDALPARLQEHFDVAINDPNLLASRYETALLQTRMVELIQRLDTGESGKLWEELRETYASLREAMTVMAAAEKAAAKADEEHDVIAKATAVRDKSAAASDFSAGLTSMGSIIKRGDDDEAAWRELVDIVNNKVTIASAELRRLKDLHQMLTTEQAMALIHSLHGTVKLAIGSLPQQQQNEILTKIGHGLKAIANIAEPEK